MLAPLILAPLIAALAQTASAGAPPPVAQPQGPALVEAVRAADAAFFILFFEGCDPVALGAMVTPDFEMYHDRDGVVARDGQTFVALYAEQCLARRAPEAWRTRRALDPASLRVEPVPGFGAIEEGDHLFYERRGTGPERLAGRARFVQLWQRDAAGGWRLARVLSYAHRPAD